MFFYSNHIFRVYVCLHCSNKLFSVAVNEVIISLTFRLNHFNRSITVDRVSPNWTNAISVLCGIGTESVRFSDNMHDKQIEKVDNTLTCITRS